ncbi:MAG: GGDEF domain-containing protein [Pseudomonadales bacterium]
MSNKKRLEIPEAEIYEFLNASRRRQLLWTTAILAVIVGSLITLRMVMVGTGNSLYAGPIALSGLIALFVALKLGFSTRYAAVILLGILTGLLALLGLLSGGLDGPVIVIAPFIPLLGTLIHGQRAGIICAIICMCIISTFAIAHVSGVNFSTHGYDVDQRSIVRAAFLIAFILVSTFVGNYFAQISDAMAASIWQHATHDHLTGLANRRSLDSSLDRELRIARRANSSLTLMMIDIDNFKKYNDSNGHLMGDQCLKKIADSLHSNVRRPADIVARYGGEEFVALLPGTPAKNAAIVAEKIKDGVAQLRLPYSTGENESEENVVTISIGVASLLNDDNYDAQQLLSRADKALYLAKENGRNRVEFAANVAESENGSKPAANDGQSLRSQQA